MKPKRPAVWEPRGESAAEVMPEWEVWTRAGAGPLVDSQLNPRIRARIAFDAWKQVHGAPAFGSCRVRRVG